MKTMWLRLQAPFAAFRYFQAGVYRATSPIMPPSVAYGLVLNLAAIEMRGSLSEISTPIRQDIPKICLAIGTLSDPEKLEKSSLYQQLHSYPVGASGKEMSARTHGAKFWISPVRREFLVGLDLIIGVKTSDLEVLERVEQGLAGKLNDSRYGLPFVGDNNFLFDRIDIISEPLESVYWYEQMSANESPRKGSCRLTVGINRTDSSKTTNKLFAPMLEKSKYPSEQAWTWTPSEIV